MPHPRSRVGHFLMLTNTKETRRVMGDRRNLKTNKRYQVRSSSDLSLSNILRAFLCILALPIVRRMFSLASLFSFSFMACSINSAINEDSDFPSLLVCSLRSRIISSGTFIVILMVFTPLECLKLNTGTDYREAEVRDTCLDHMDVYIKFIISHPG